MRGVWGSGAVMSHRHASHRLLPHSVCPGWRAPGEREVGFKDLSNVGVSCLTGRRPVTHERVDAGGGAATAGRPELTTTAGVYVVPMKFQ